jgi:hypothetical protein
MATATTTTAKTAARILQGITGNAALQRVIVGCALALSSLFLCLIFKHRL